MDDTLLSQQAWLAWMYEADKHGCSMKAGGDVSDVSPPVALPLELTRTEARTHCECS